MSNINHQWVLAHEWIAVVVQLGAIYFWCSKCKSSYIIWNIDFILLLAVIIYVKRNLFFHCRMLNDICYCDDVVTLTSQWNRCSYFTGWNTSFKFHLEISLFHWHLCNNAIYKQTENKRWMSSSFVMYQFSLI